MSLSAPRPVMLAWPALSRRLIVALAALALVAGVLALAAYFAGAFGPVRTPPRNPFGTSLPREALPSTTGIGGVLLAWQSSFYRELTATLKAIAQTPTALWGLLGLSFGYGVFHAAGPGRLGPAPCGRAAGAIDRPVQLVRDPDGRHAGHGARQDVAAHATSRVSSHGPLPMLS